MTPSPAGSGELRHVDLHMHSTASDGTATPEEVARSAAECLLGAIALTDHDTVDGVAAATAAASALGVQVVAGVELSAVEGGRETHLLGLHLQDTGSMADALSDFRLARHERGIEMVRRLNGLGVELSFDTVLETADGAALGRPHVARALVAGGWAVDLREAFDRYIGAGAPAFVEKQRLSLVDAIGLIHDAGGLAVLAHPGGDWDPQSLSRLKAVGLDGIEVLHPSHSDETAARLDSLAGQCGLLRSGGSDWHGGQDGRRKLGSMRVPWQWLERQRDALGAA